MKMVRKLFNKCIFDIEHYQLLARYHGRFRFATLILPVNPIVLVLAAVLIANEFARYILINGYI